MENFIFCAVYVVLFTVYKKCTFRDNAFYFIITFWELWFQLVFII